MQTFQYQARHSSGHLIFGIQDAENEESLAALLRDRGLSLAEAKVLSIHAGLLLQKSELPRLVQLRVGERLREALLTELPSHEAVRAIASEPFEHPLLMMMPWLMGSAAMLTAAAALLNSATNLPSALFWGCTGLTILLGLSWIWLNAMLITRPRRMLLQMADQLESGQMDFSAQPVLVPDELKAIQTSSMSPELKAISIAELIPEVTEMRTHRHRLAVRVLGPFFMWSVLSLGIAAFLEIVVPQFSAIYAGFGVQLPLMTALLIGLSDATAVFSGFLIPVCGLTLLLSLCFLYMLITQDALAFVASRIPILGASICWLIQARICRILSVLLRNHTMPSEALTAATCGTGLRQVQQEGAEVVSVLQQSGDDYQRGRYLRGLPLSLLGHLQQRSSGRQTELETAQVFEGFAKSLENAATGHGAILIVFLEILGVVSVALLAGWIVISLFYPLQQLLGGLLFFGNSLGVYLKWRRLS